MSVSLTSAPALTTDLEITRRYELSPDLVTLTDKRPNEAEAIRTMRTHIVARHLESGRRGIAVCSVTGGVGCTFTASNLAVSLAQIGVSTLLIDGDLRSPGVERFIRPLAPAPGLSQCLMSDAVDPSDVIHSDVIPNLSVLFSGHDGENAQELLGGEAFKILVDRQLRDFEFTIIDTPPTDHSSDARRISTVMGYSVIVARRDVSFLNQVTRLAKELQEDGVRLVGTVLNEI